MTNEELKAECVDLHHQVLDLKEELHGRRANVWAMFAANTLPNDLPYFATFEKYAEARAKSADALLAEWDKRFGGTNHEAK